MTLNALNYSCYRELNDAVKASPQSDITIENCLGQRYIGCALSDKNIIIKGTAGNGTGAYLDGAQITVYGNAQDAVADTMNGGNIIIHGSCGDAAGYGMRGGSVYIKGDVGYRAGIHMKAYKDKFPVMVIGGNAGSFLAEYQAGGLIIVLGIEEKGDITGFNCGTGMHGGKVILRCDNLPKGISSKVNAKIADIKKYQKYIKYFCQYFNFDFDKIINRNFFELTANSEQPYRQLYTYN